MGIRGTASESELPRLLKPVCLKWKKNSGEGETLVIPSSLFLSTSTVLSDPVNSIFKNVFIYFLFSTNALIRSMHL